MKNLAYSNRSQPSSSKAKFTIATLVIACITLFALVCWWRKPPVVLDQFGYDVTIALYRVCNQQNSEGLGRLENTLIATKDSTSQDDPSRDAIATVIEKAKRGQWTDAQSDCRQLLEDQVGR